MKKIILICLILVSIIFGQDISYNKEFQVNTYEKGIKYNPSVISISKNKFVICWQSDNQDGSDFGIYAQVFNNDFKKLGEEIQVNTYTEGFQRNPSIAELYEDRFVICWESENQDGSEGGIFAQIFYNNGDKLGEEFQVNTITNNDQACPSITAISDSTFLVSWHSNHNGYCNHEIKSQIFNNDGKKLGEEISVNYVTDDDQKAPSVENISDDKFIICWNNDTDCEIYGQIFNNVGKKIGSEIQVNTYTEGLQRNPSITKLYGDRFVICWESECQNGCLSRIYLQLFNHTGNRIGEEIQLKSYTYTFQQSPSVSSIANKKFIVCWRSYKGDGTDGRISAQIFNNLGDKVGQQFQINKNTSVTSVINISKDKFVVSYSNFYDIYAKYYLNEPINHDLKNFNIVSPVMDATSETNKPEFSWQKANTSHINFPWEMKYELYLSKNNNFEDKLIYKNIHDTTFKIPDTLETGQTYFWKVLAKNLDGDSLWSSNINGFYVSEDATDIEKSQTIIPDKFKLHQNFPNPFNPLTNIAYDLPPGTKQYKVVIKIYDLRGNFVKILENSEKGPGQYIARWDGTDQAGQKVANGLYIYSINAGRYKESGKMILLK